MAGALMVQIATEVRSAADKAHPFDAILRTAPVLRVRAVASCNCGGGGTPAVGVGRPNCGGTVP
jgi:hypothetical protein